LAALVIPGVVPETSYHPPWYSADTNHMTPRLPDAVEHWPLDRLIPCARNARTHDDVQVAHIAASIAEFGWTNAVSGYDFIAPIVGGVDVSSIAAQVPSWAWPIVLICITVVFQFLRNLADKRHNAELADTAAPAQEG
jgi:hypothetical protein